MLGFRDSAHIANGLQNQEQLLKKPAIAGAPKATKTAEKPKTNMAELSISKVIFLSAERRSVMSSIERPDTNSIYLRINGSTQGDRNYRSPAAKTIRNDNSCSIINNICLFRILLIPVIVCNQSWEEASRLQKIQVFSGH